jgi:hypothetical protein
VVDVGVGGEHDVHLAGMEGQLVFFDLVPALLQAAVNEDALAAGVDAMAAAGDGTGCTKKRQFHGKFLLFIKKQV